MAYYLTIKDRKSGYKPIDIVKASCFSRLSDLKGYGSTLEEIDAFTMNFDDENELRRFLFNERLLDLRDGGRALSIRRLYNNRYIKVTYDLLYQRDIEDVMDPRRVIKKINNKLYAKDFRFVEKFASHYMKRYECSSTAPEVRAAAIDSIREGYIDSKFFQVDENHDQLLTRMVKLLLYKYYQKMDGRTVYKNEIVYRNLHSLIAFIDNYNQKYENKEGMESDTDTSELVSNERESLEKSNDIHEVSKEQFDTIKYKTKSRKKNVPVPGQTSLF